jgi:recombination endonuclease VII
MTAKRGRRPCQTCSGTTDMRNLRCRDCRRPSSPSRTAKRAGGGSRQSVYLILTRDEWVQLYAHQQGYCYICSTPLRNRYQPETWAEDEQQAYLDHDHRLEKIAGLRASVRGLLCLWCNRRILVALHDSAEKARRAADYLRNPPARSILGL